MWVCINRSTDENLNLILEVLVDTWRQVSVFSNHNLFFSFTSSPNWFLTQFTSDVESNQNTDTRVCILITYICQIFVKFSIQNLRQVSPKINCESQFVINSNFKSARRSVTFWKNQSKQTSYRTVHSSCYHRTLNQYNGYSHPYNGYHYLNCSMNSSFWYI